MRTFKIVPVSQGLDVHHLWKLVAVEADGSETVTETYDRMADAEAAKTLLEQTEVDIRS